MSTDLQSRAPVADGTEEVLEELERVEAERARIGEDVRRLEADVARAKSETVAAQTRVIVSPTRWARVVTILLVGSLVGALLAFGFSKIEGDGRPPPWTPPSGPAGFPAVPPRFR